MFKKTIFFLSFILFSIAKSYAQPFTISLEPVNITNLGGLHSYAFGQSGGKWLLVGGRLDGLHQRQPFSAFDVANNNTELIVVDPITLQKWSAPLATLPTAMQEQLSSTNMEFYQDGDYLYFIGGYGYSATASNHITYSKLTAIKVPDVINAIINGTSFTSFFRQITDAKFQVTGGRLRKINTNYYLVGGQKFIGKYNPNGPDSGPGFVQEYTDAIRVFSINDDGTTITINHIQSFVDNANLHRRDFNVESQILPNGNEGLTAFSGVFQTNANLPFLNSVLIDANGYTVNTTFQQFYNHYHCAVIPLYAATRNEMHTVFFGGMAQYYDDNGTLTQDDNVPFVNTIARVTRDANGVMAEYKLPITMPSLLGSGSEFIPNKDIPHYPNEVLKLDNITANNTLIGYIYGGIRSSAANIFFSNTGMESRANNQIFKVFLTNTTLSIDDLNEQSIGTLKIEVYPVPNNGDFIIKYNLIKSDDVKIIISDITGREIKKIVLKNQRAGENIYRNNTSILPSNGMYFLRIETSYEKVTRKVIIKQ